MFNKKIIILLLVIVFFVITFSIANRAGLFLPKLEEETVFDQEIVNQKINTQEVEYEIVEVARDLFVPWSILFTSKDRLLVAERNGNITEINQSSGEKKILYKFSDVSTNAEEGLMGLALDTNYSENNYIYACYAYPDEEGISDRVVRLIDSIDEIVFDQIIIDEIPAARFHAGCRIEFGPDNKLYVTTGDATDKNIAQDYNSLGGKILRLNADGSIPNDNPIEDSYIYSLGHRNPQGIDWDASGNLYSSEHGPSVFDGPAGGDELNLITAGSNYGWPLVSHEKTQQGLVDPLVLWTPAIAPGSLMIYKSDALPQFTNDIFIGGLKGEGIFRVIIDNNNIGKWERVVSGYGRIREIVESPSGEIYFTTSNQDGRGKLNEGDDKIYKITPVN